MKNQLQSQKINHCNFNSAKKSWQYIYLILELFYSYFRSCIIILTLFYVKDFIIYSSNKLTPDGTLPRNNNTTNNVTLLLSRINHN